MTETMEFMPIDIKLKLVLPVDDDVIHQAQNTGQVGKDLIHLLLKMLRDIGDTEGHLVKTKAAKWGNECSQMT